MIWMIDLSSWIITEWDDVESISYISTHFSFWLIPLSYLGHVSFCCTILLLFLLLLCFLYLPLSYYLSLLSPFLGVFFHWLSPSLLSISLWLPVSSFSCLHFTPPYLAHRGFCPVLHTLKNWYICYRSIVSHWPRCWVQSEPHSITQIPHRASDLATHRRPNSHSVRALISWTCFSCNIRAVRRSTRWG